jgi:hypothetical protein
MHRLTFLLLAFAVGVAACGDKKPANDATGKTDKKDASSDEGDEGDGKTAAKGDGGAEAPAPPKKDECIGHDIPDIEAAVLKSSCEVANAKPDSLPNPDLKGKLEIALSPSPAKIGAGQKTDIMVTFANKTKEPLTLHFRLDPTARFETEAYDAKSKRVDMPAGNPPSPPKGHTQAPPTEPKVARLTIAPGGNARARVSWEAVKTKWAPEKLRGTPAEKGFPRVPAGPLPKGKYSVKVVTPLVGVLEGPEHEFSAPKIDIEVDK